MDACRIEAYLRSACSVLDFEIGEFWCIRNIPGQRPTLKFIQLYTSPVIEEFYTLLLRPETSTQEDTRCDEEKHRFSPIICRGVSDGGKIVWANTCTTQGLVGRSDLALNTAVGVPMCSIGCDLYVLILFSLESIRMSQHAMEFLCASAKIVAEPSCCFLPASASTIVTPARVEHFIGLWDMVELMNAYSDDVAFQTLPVDRLQYYFDLQDRSALKDIFNDIKQMQNSNSGFTAKQLNSLLQLNNSSLGIEMGEGGVPKPLAESVCSMDSGHWASTLSRLSVDHATATGRSFSGLPGAFTVDIPDPSHGSERDRDRDRDKDRHDRFEAESYSTSVVDTYSDYDSVLDRYVSCPIIDVRHSYHKSNSRFHEFMVALLGMTIFDAAELWLKSDSEQDMFVVAALHRNGIMSMWTDRSRSLRLKKSVDVPGHVLESGNPYWDKFYDQHSTSDEGYPRATLASSLHVRTAFAIPLPGSEGVGGVLALYSTFRVDVDLELVSFVVKALQLLSASAIDSEVLANCDIESLMKFPRQQLEEWLVEVPDPALTQFTHTASVTTLHSACKMNGSVTLTVVSESHADGEVTVSALPKSISTPETFTIRSMGSLADPRSELSTLYAKKVGAPVVSKAKAAPTRAQLRRSMSDTSSSASSASSATTSATVLSASTAAPYGIAALSQPLPSPTAGMNAPTNPYQRASPTSPVYEQFHRQLGPEGSRVGSHPPSVSEAQSSSSGAQGSPLGSSNNLLKKRAGPLAADSGSLKMMRKHEEEFSYGGVDALSAAAAAASQGLKGSRASSPSLPPPLPMSAPAPALSPSPMMQMHMPTYGQMQQALMQQPFMQQQGMQSPYSYMPNPQGNLGYAPIYCQMVTDPPNMMTPLASMPQYKCLEPVALSCRVPGCLEVVRSSNICAMHSSGKRCIFEGCFKCSQGGTGFCIAHGGGRRCTYTGCIKGARDKFFCAGHGGGKRCVSDGCSKSAVGGSAMCTAHGGGKRCQVEGCTRSAQSKSTCCVRHGGGRKCNVAGCVKVARGKTNFCAAHRDGVGFQLEEDLEGSDSGVSASMEDSEDVSMLCKLSSLSSRSIAELSQDDSQ